MLVTTLVDQPVTFLGNSSNEQCPSGVFDLLKTILASRKKLGAFLFHYPVTSHFKEFAHQISSCSQQMITPTQELCRQEVEAPMNLTSGSTVSSKPLVKEILPRLSWLNTCQREGR